jgi:hypothetical protein
MCCEEGLISYRWVAIQGRTSGHAASEPVFGIIKSVMGFRQFLLRGLDQVQGEWSLVTMRNVSTTLRQSKFEFKLECLGFSAVD